MGADKTLPLTAPTAMMVRAWLGVLVLAWNWLRETAALDLDALMSQLMSKCRPCLQTSRTLLWLGVYVWRGSLG